MLALLRHRSQLLAARLRAGMPCCCALCGCGAASVLCDGCRQRYLAPPAPRCRQCATLLPAGAGAASLCGSCLRRPPAFDATVVVTDYEAPLDQLVLDLKFGAQLALAPLFGGLLAQAMRRQPSASWPALLAPVPLGGRRLAERGFNQALEIGRTLARDLGLPLRARLLERCRDTAPQTLLAPGERRANLRQAFAVPAAMRERVRGRHVGVIDDVITTGVTLDEIAATLKRAGAVRVTCLAFARTPRR
ncbi:ComF family protein [Noviherbaspirillum suwonense]|uniref:ComF family protein n=1 Tax=Noviherbaspirillum suwonense TaxID=1224511 RepID=A0ABY1QE79_9BURK|nr:ComF family protein [Noviherbaspirillum suwonense]SMP68992.1 comF family protein [Noviherbaspirillum suwonense]